MFRPIHLSVLLTFLGLAIGGGFYYQNKNHSLVEPISAETDETRVLTTQDFDVFGREIALRENPTMRVQIHPELAPLTFTIDSFAPPTTGAIKIYSDDGVTLLQRIELPDPNMRLADRIHENFNVADINFDGYTDIGVLVDGGVKWGSYQYWLFDITTNTFVSSTFTDEFRKLTFNNLKLDTATKQIKINNFEGTLMAFEDLYQVDNEQLILLEEKYQEQPYSPANDGTPLKKCVETITTHNEQTARVQKIVTPEFCPGYY